MRLLAITPPAAVLPKIHSGLVEAWLSAGAGALGLAVLLREPRASAAAILDDPRLGPLREALADRQIPTLLSVDADADADRREPATLERIRAARPALAGVQLRGDPSPELCARWREALPGLVLGRSCHGPTPRSNPAVDYSVLAPVFAPKTAQPGVVKRAIGLAALRRWSCAVPRVLALGGVEPDNAAACLAAGAVGIAGISLFFGRCTDAHDNVAALVRAFEGHERPDDDHAAQARPRR